ncbi:MAG TPA: preprotein translocase subunit SecG [Bryobacteraceae bacterium]|jgi:preprotein translocase subunit SecG|nr:preprotein translocase subunit SecG [Bryobacteraceae bacterium]
MLTVFLTIIHVIVSLFLVIVVLLQSGKAADLAGAFGGMGSQTAFGPRGSATVLSKATAVGAALFMVTSLWLSVLATRSAGDRIGSSVLDRQPKKTQSSQPAKAPATPAPQGSHPVPVQTTPATPAK